MLPKNQQSKNEIEDSPDPTWKGLYKAGGISEILYLLLALVTPFFTYINHTQLVARINGTDVINYIIENGYAWWISLKSLVLGTSFFPIRGLNIFGGGCFSTYGLSPWVGNFIN